MNIKFISIITLALFGILNASFLEKYPAIPHVKLGDLPTRVGLCEEISKQFGCKIFCKHDQETGRRDSSGMRLFGGNKLRKLEVVLADALKKDAKIIITFGCAGSNHALATTIYSKQLGLKTICFLSPQPNSSVVKRNLLLQQHYGAELRYSNSGKERRAAAAEHIQELEKEGIKPYVIATGASMPLGVIGFINAVFELQQQIAAGQMPQPDYIYVPAGSLGTTVGLLMGLQLVGAPTQVIGVAVEGSETMYDGIRKLFDETRILLLTIDPTLNLSWNENRLILLTQYCGTGYGCSTEAGAEATKLFATDGINLEGTYTAKAAAALLNDAQSGSLKDKITLFWMTFCSDSFDEIVDKVSYKDLPQAFHKYFE